MAGTLLTAGFFDFDTPIGTQKAVYISSDRKIVQFNNKLAPIESRIKRKKGWNKAIENTRIMFGKTPCLNFDDFETKRLKELWGFVNQYTMKDDGIKTFEMILDDYVCAYAVTGFVGDYNDAIRSVFEGKESVKLDQFMREISNKLKEKNQKFLQEIKDLPIFKFDVKSQERYEAIEKHVEAEGLGIILFAAVPKPKEAAPKISGPPVLFKIQSGCEPELVTTPCIALSVQARFVEEQLKMVFKEEQKPKCTMQVLQGYVGELHMLASTQQEGYEFINGKMRGYILAEGTSRATRISHPAKPERYIRFVLSRVIEIIRMTYSNRTTTWW